MKCNKCIKEVKFLYDGENCSICGTQGIDELKVQELMFTKLKKYFDIDEKEVKCNLNLEQLKQAKEILENHLDSKELEKAF